MNINSVIKDRNYEFKYGARLGTRDTVDNPEATVTLSVVHLDGDYDASGVYWGAGEPLWCAMSDEGDVEIYVRAGSYKSAVAKITDKHPELRIVRPTEICVDLFITEYIRAMLWSTTDDDGNPMDKNYSIDDISPEFMARITEDCQAFIEKNAQDLLTWDGRYSVEEMGGHDFWLTRNGHGAGFWDGDWDKEVGKRLTEASHAFGELWLYVGDDGLIYA